MQIPAEPKVIIRSCRAYDPEAIRRIFREGIEELGLRPFGRTLVKPNLVAAGDMFPYAFTRPEVGEGMVRALQDVGGSSMTELAVGERCGITVPTRLSFKESGWNDVVHRTKVKRYCFEEEPQVEIPLRHDGRLRDYLFTPEPVARADFFVNLPKFKAHPWTTVTFGTKAYIGIQDDRHRLIDHDHKLNEKIRDLQFIIQPQLIAIDAITAGEGRMLTPTPFDLGLLIMGNSQLAFDAVCCAIIGDRPAHRRPPAAHRGGRVRHPRRLQGGDLRRRLARGGPGPGQGLQGRPHPGREVLRGHQHQRLRRTAARVRALRLLLGRLPGRDRGGHRDPPGLRQGHRRQDAAAARRVRRLRRRRSTPPPASGSSSSATAAPGRASSPASRSRSGRPTRTARPTTPTTPGTTTSSRSCR